MRELGALLSREMTFDAKLVTISDVSLTPDFKNCHVHVSVIGTDEDKRRAIHALADRRAWLQHEMSRRVVLKFTPQLHFHLDDSIERGTRVMAILENLEVPPAVEVFGDAEDDEAPPETHGVEEDTSEEEVDAEEEDDDSEPPAPAPRRGRGQSRSERPGANRPRS